VQTNGKAKGKGVKEVSSATDVTCSNGFEPLGSLNALQEIRFFATTFLQQHSNC
jgi:hypothetical protein